jgi:outer membrane protein assembly factor BamB
LEILISSNGVAQSYAAADGKLLWEVTELKGNTVASPSVTSNAVLIGSGDPGHSLLIRRDGQGDVSQSHVAWRTEEASSSFGSPLLHQGRAYFVNKAGVAFALDVETGQKLWNTRLPDSTWASPVAAGDRVYFFCKNGETVVARSADKFEKLAENKLTVQTRLYGVAVAGGGFLIRDGRRLTFIQDKQTPSPSQGNQQ